MRARANRIDPGRLAPPEIANSRPRAKVLILDDEAVVRFSVGEFLRSKGYATVEADCCRKAREAFRAERFDAAILDYSLPDGTALDLLSEFKATDGDVPIILLTGHGSIDLAVTAIKQGAEQFLAKPVELPALLLLLEKAIDYRRTRQRDQAGTARFQREASDPFAGRSTVIRELAQTCQRLRATSTPVLIYGETGAGKSLLARWLHENGPRRREAFVDLNCAGLSHELLDSELFGHERGAFTGAVTSKPGLLEIGDRGTVFLDEIGDMHLSIQAKLLKVLDEKQFRRMGSVHLRRVDIHLIAATHRNLADLVRTEKFRDDLYFRVNAVPVRVPALRERPADIPVLAAQLLDVCAADVGRARMRLLPDAVEALTKYTWPGNIRELRNILERAVLLCDREVLGRNDLRFEAERTAGPDSTFDLREAERINIEKVLHATAGNVPRAARLLGIGKTTLYRKLVSYGISRFKFGPSAPA